MVCLTDVGVVDYTLHTEAWCPVLLSQELVLVLDSICGLRKFLVDPCSASLQMLSEAYLRRVWWAWVELRGKPRPSTVRGSLTASKGLLSPGWKGGVE